MAEWRFYQLTRQSLDQALPTMLEKVLQRGQRAVVRADAPERLESLDAHLWSYRDDSFVPHGLADKNAAEQPVLLTQGDEQPNGGRVLFLLDGLNETALDWDLVCLVFSGADEAALANARSAWKLRKDTGDTIAYYQQDERGGWEKKA
jgi:DNA polymerase III subunit chi